MRYRLLIALILFVAGCSPSARAVKALKSGDYCEFCRISADGAHTEPNSIHNLGLCYENGWCGYSKSREQAVRQYTIGARWGVQESAHALTRLGYEPPAADLKMAQDLAEARDRAAMWGAVAAAVASATNQANRQPNYNAYQSNGMNAFVPTANYQGCCSYHAGIHRNMYGKVSCHFSGMVLCNDLQPSPTCRCL